MNKQNNYTPEELELLEAAGFNTDDNSSEEENNDINTDNSADKSGNPDNIKADPQTAAVDNPDNSADNTQPQNNEPANTQTTPLILGKFKSVDELINAYTNLESYSGRQASQISELNQKLSANVPANGNSPVPSQNTKITQDFFQNVTDEQLQDYMVSNPKEFFNYLINDVVLRARNEVSRDNSVNDYVQKFFSDNPDMAGYIDEFKSLTEEIGNPEYALNIIRGKKAGNLTSLLSDERFIQDNLNNGNLDSLLSDDKIASRLSNNVKQKIIDEYVKGLEASKSNVNLMNNSSGAISKLPPKSYGNMYEMHDDAVEFLKQLEKERK